MLRGSQPAAEGCQGSRRGRSSTERRQGRRASRRRSGIYRGRRGDVASGLLRRGGRVILLARPDFSNFTTAEVKPTMSSWSCRYQKAASPQSRACVCLLATLTLVTSSPKVTTPGTLIVLMRGQTRRRVYPHISTTESPQSENHRQDREAEWLNHRFAAIEVLRWGSRPDWSPSLPAQRTLPIEYSRLAPFRAIIDAFSVLRRHATVPIPAMRAFGVPHPCLGRAA